MPSKFTSVHLCVRLTVAAVIVDTINVTGVINYVVRSVCIIFTTGHAKIVLYQVVILNRS